MFFGCSGLVDNHLGKRVAGAQSLFIDIVTPTVVATKTTITEAAVIWPVEFKADMVTVANYLISVMMARLACLWCCCCLGRF